MFSFSPGDYCIVKFDDSFLPIAVSYEVAVLFLFLFVLYLCF